MKMSAKQKAAFLARMAKGRKAAARKKKPARPKKATVKKRAPKKHRRRRRLNPEQMAEAVAMYERFHGRAPARISDYEQPFEYRSELAQLGKLIELRFDLDADNEDVPIRNFAGTEVACTPDGENLYLIRGDMTIDLDALDIDSEKDYIELGPCTYISYHTRKGFHDFAPIDYWHRFGEEDGILPVLMYDSINHVLWFAGGNYKVKPEGIVN